MRMTPSVAFACTVLLCSTACETQSRPTAPSSSVIPSTAAQPGPANRSINSASLAAAQSLTAGACPLVISGASATPDTLWSPNHKWNDVAVAYTATDVCTLVSPPTCSLSVTSDEPVNGRGDGNTAPDWVVVNSHLVRLRAERSGTGDGRVYTIAITCAATVLDTSGAVATTFPVRGTQTVNVTVAHDQRKS